MTTARGLFLLAAGLSFLASVVIYFSGSENEGIFVGLWVPSILALGTFIAPSLYGVGIFAFGVVVTAIADTACWLIAWGIVTERRDRLALEAEQREAAGVVGERPGTSAPAIEPDLNGAGMGNAVHHGG